MLDLPIQPMLLHKSDHPPAGDEWLHSVKWDGHRAILVQEGSKTRIFTRHRNECTRQYPELQDIELSQSSVILDGEMVVFEEGKPCFESVMTRLLTQQEIKINRLRRNLPAHFVAFDVLYAGNKSVMSMPAERRHELLMELVHPSESISVCQTFDDGVGLFEATRKMGLEGIVSVHRDSAYHPGTRSRQWLKIKHWSYDIVRIGAIRKGTFGWSLLQGEHHVGVLEFAPSAARKAVYDVAKSLNARSDAAWTYLEPRIEIEVKFQSRTKRGYMRSSSFVRFVAQNGIVQSEH